MQYHKSAGALKPCWGYHIIKRYGLTVCVNAIHAGSVDADTAKWLVTQEMLEREIAKVKKAKAEHSGWKRKSRRMVGFQPN